MVFCPFIDMCPDFDFFLKRLDVFMHTLDTEFRYMINISLPIHI